MKTPFHVMAKPVGAVCNLDCRYCYYLEKESMYPASGSMRMTPDVLETYIRSYIENHPEGDVHFAWQGGEPTLMGLDFFQSALTLQQRYAGGRSVFNAIQTNGTLLDDTWCEFFSRHNMLVGISVDGPRALHDVYRRDKRGRATFDDVMRGLGFLKKHGVSFNTLTVVHRANSGHPEDVYSFLTSIGSTFLQFIPLVERKPGPVQASSGLHFHPPPFPAQAEADVEVSDFSVEPETYGKFLVAVFEQWRRRDVGRIFVQLIDVALANHMGLGSGMCVFSETCGRALALEHNGDVYSCDHYVYPEYRLGNLMHHALGDMVASPEQIRFGNAKRDTLPRYCLECEVLDLCRGECPKHRFTKTPDGEPGLNYLCRGYRMFFNHLRPHLIQMERVIRGMVNTSDLNARAK
ncbi:MAG TPA: anaerobic sulfatase maturase [Kiritimatiellia bacterium]|nr:anaerobic sulfatase maturase [Kiritimatiellia bacterium]